MKPRTAKLKFYNYNNIINARGECDLLCECQNKRHWLHFKIKGSQKPLLSGKTCSNMGLITINLVNQVTIDQSADDLIKEHSDVSYGFGCLEGEYHIEVDLAVPPVQRTPQHVPVALKEKLEAKIEELEEREIIRRVEEPTPWISSLVAVLNPGKLESVLIQEI